MCAFAHTLGRGVCGGRACSAFMVAAAADNKIIRGDFAAVQYLTRSATVLRAFAGISWVSYKFGVSDPNHQQAVGGVVAANAMTNIG